MDLENIDHEREITDFDKYVADWLGAYFQLERIRFMDGYFLIQLFDIIRTEDLQGIFNKTEVIESDLGGDGLTSIVVYPDILKISDNEIHLFFDSMYEDERGAVDVRNN